MDYSWPGRQKGLNANTSKDIGLLEGAIFPEQLHFKPNPDKSFLLSPCPSLITEYTFKTDNHGICIVNNQMAGFENLNNL